MGSLQRHWVDLAMLVWLAVSVAVGVARGVLFETLSLLGWGVAYFGAAWAAPFVQPHLPAEPGPEFNRAAALLCAFLALLLAWSVAARLLRLFVRATPLDVPDRVFGAGFGAARGVLVLLVLACAVGLTPMVQSPAWRGSHGAAWLNAALHGLKPLLPSEISMHLPA